MRIQDIVTFADEYLHAGTCSDVALNGLQIAGSLQCRCLATAASASQAAIDAAVSAGADTLLVHHGLLWKGGLQAVAGPLKRRLKTLLDADMNLLAYHLPLDAHPEAGNNALLCRLAGITGVSEYPGFFPAVRGFFSRPQKIGDLCRLLASKLDAPVSVAGLTDPERTVETAAVCSGSGSFVLDNNPLFADQVLLTGDIREQSFHLAAEAGVSVLVLGHHASEQAGVHALGQLLAQRFELRHVPLSFAVERAAGQYV